MSLIGVLWVLFFVYSVFCLFVWFINIYLHRLVFSYILVFEPKFVFQMQYLLGFCFVFESGFCASLAIVAFEIKFKMLSLWSYIFHIYYTENAAYLAFKFALKTVNLCSFCFVGYICPFCTVFTSTFCSVSCFSFVTK